MATPTSAGDAAAGGPRGGGAEGGNAGQVSERADNSPKRYGDGAATLKAGDPVQGFWTADASGAGEWCPGTFASLNAANNGTALVDFDSGEIRRLPAALVVPQADFATFAKAQSKLKVGDRVHAPRLDAATTAGGLPKWSAGVITREEGSATRRAFGVKFDRDGKVLGIKAASVFPRRDGVGDEEETGVVGEAKQEARKQAASAGRKGAGKGRPNARVKTEGDTRKPSSRDRIFCGRRKVYSDIEFSGVKKQKTEDDSPLKEARLSLKDPAYKAVMFAKFQESEARGLEGEKQYPCAALGKEVMDLLEARGVERFFRMQGRGKNAGYKKVDRDSALQKIKSDFTRRSETYPYWGACAVERKRVRQHMRDKARRNLLSRKQDAGMPGIDDVGDDGYKHYCFVCQDGGEDLLCCDGKGCTNVCHFDCHYPKLAEEPDEFHCAECANAEVYAFDWQRDGGDEWRFGCSLGTIESLSYEKKNGKVKRFCDVKLLDSGEVKELEDTFVIPKDKHRPGRAYNEGDKVMAPWIPEKGDAEWYAGTVKSSALEPETSRVTYSVKFDNTKVKLEGELERGVRSGIDGDQLVPVAGNEESDDEQIPALLNPAEQSSSSSGEDNASRQREVVRSSDNTPQRSVHFDTEGREEGGDEKISGSPKMDPEGLLHATKVPSLVAAAPGPGPFEPTSAEKEAAAAAAAIHVSATKSEPLSTSQLSAGDAPPLPPSGLTDTSMSTLRANSSPPEVPSVIGFKTKESISEASMSSLLNEKDPLLLFLRSQQKCIKGSVDEYYSWLLAKDIDSMSMLKEAVSDAELLNEPFPTTLLVEDGSFGVKGFKQNVFLRAVSDYEEVEPTKAEPTKAEASQTKAEASPTKDEASPMPRVKVCEPPADLICPIGKNLMKNPVIAQDGVTYEKANFENFFRTEIAEKGMVFSPVVAGRKIDHCAYTPNTNVLNRVTEFQEAQLMP